MSPLFRPWFGRRPLPFRAGPARARRSGNVRAPALPLRAERLESRVLLSLGNGLGDAVPVSFRPNGTADVPGYLATPADVQLVGLDLSAGDTVTAAVHAQLAGSALQGALRVFRYDGPDAHFAELRHRLTFDPRARHGAGALAAATPIASQEGAVGRDPRLTFQAATDGIYFVGVSAAGNTSYDPRFAGSGQAGATYGSFGLALTKAETPLTPDLAAASLTISGNPVAWGDAIDHGDLRDREPRRRPGGGLRRGRPPLCGQHRR